MDWFRHKHGLSTDSKLGFVASRCGVHRAFVVLLWSYMLERASACSDRGKLAAFDRDEASFALDMDREQIDAIVAEMEKRGLVVRGEVANWNRHQFQSDNSYERVKRHRERSKALPETDDETHHETLQPVTGDVSGNVSETDRTEQNRTDQIRENAREARTTNGSYRWSGRIIRLTETDFDRWAKAFTALDLPAHLEPIDQWLAGHEAKPSQRKNWFNLVANLLRKRHEEALAERRLAEAKPKPIKEGYGYGIV